MAVTFTGTPNVGGVGIDSLLAELSSIGNRGNYNVAMKLPKPKPPAALGAFGGLPPGTTPNTGVTAGTGSVPGDLGRLMRAIGGQESGGYSNPYAARNPHSGAMGKYQVMPANIAGNRTGWDWDALGRDVSVSEFMSNPSIQEAIARHRLGQYLKNWGMAGAAATWYGGTWGRNNMYSKTPQNGYPSMYEYVMSILNKA